jgi:HEAT repeat-containing protein 5
LARRLGTSWIESHLSLFINHILELAGNPRASTSHVDAVYSRKCITFILRSVIGSRLGEKAQFSAARELATIITRYTTPQPLTTNNSLTLSGNDGANHISSMNSSTNSMIQSFTSSTSNLYESSSNIEHIQHILICALHELSILVQSLGTSTSLLLQDSCQGLIDTLFLVILNPSHSVRLSAAWCLRSITTALPSLMTPLIDRCLEKMNLLAKQSNSYNTDAMSGFALALQALLGAVHRCPLGSFVCLPSNEQLLVD